MRKCLSTLATSLICAAALLWPALYNHFPIMSVDSSAYLQGALEGFYDPTLGGPPGYAYFRPYTYSFIITAIRHFFGFWGIICAQALAVSFLAGSLLRDIFSFNNKTIIITILFLSLISSVAWHVSTIMPDIFAGCIPLAFFILYFSENVKTPGYILTFLIAIISASVHYSHLPLSLASFIFFVAISVLTGGKSIRRLAVLALVPLCASIIFCSFNYEAFKKFSVDPYSRTSLFAHLAASGVVGEVLQEDCSTHEWALCSYTSSLAPLSPIYATFDSFLWMPESPFNKLGGPAKLTPEIDQIIAQAIRQHPIQIAANSLVSGLEEMFSLRIGGVSDLNSKTEIRTMNDSLSWVSPSGHEKFDASRQGQGSLSVFPVQLYGSYVVWYLSLAVVGVTIVIRKQDIRVRLFYAYILLYWVANAFLCGAVAEVQDRFNTRVAWLVPFCLAMDIILSCGLFKRKPE